MLEPEHEPACEVLLDEENGGLQVIETSPNPGKREFEIWVDDVSPGSSLIAAEPAAVEGIPLRDGVETLIARSPEEWVDAIASIYTDESRWTALSDACRAFAREEYSFALGRRTMRKILESLDIFLAEDATGMHVRSARPLEGWGDE